MQSQSAAVQIAHELSATVAKASFIPDSQAHAGPDSWPPSASYQPPSESFSLPPSHSQRDFYTPSHMVPISRSPTLPSRQPLLSGHSTEYFQHNNAAGPHGSWRAPVSMGSTSAGMYTSEPVPSIAVLDSSDLQSVSKGLSSPERRRSIAVATDGDGHRGDSAMLPH